MFYSKIINDNLKTALFAKTNEMNSLFHLTNLADAMKRACMFITRMKLTTEEKQFFCIEEDFNAFARYLNKFFPTLEKLKFHMVTVEDIKKIHEIKDADKYYEYLRDQDFIDTKKLFNKSHYDNIKKIRQPNEDFLDKLLPIEDFLTDQLKNDIENRDKARSKIIIDLFETDSIQKYERYYHTLNLIKGLVAILNQDYDFFVRLDNKAKKRDETFLTRAQFKSICKTMEQITENIKKGKGKGKNKQEKKVNFLALLIGLAITHDYGVENPNDVSGHQNLSAELCRSDLEKLEFSKYELDLIELIIKNHCYYGDLSLGEGTYAYCQKLLLEKGRIPTNWSWKENFLAILWLLSILDINATAGGYLSKEKMEIIGELYNEENFAKATQDKNIEDLLKLKITYINNNYPGRKLDYEKIKLEFVNIYFQYFIGFFNSTDEKGLAYLKEKDAVLMINKIVELYEKTSQLGYKSITVKKRVDQDAEAINDFVKKLSDTKGKVEILSETTGAFYGFQFRIIGDCLSIDNEHSD